MPEKQEQEPDERDPKAGNDPRQDEAILNAHASCLTEE
jgi:hypothetical protein